MKSSEFRMWVNEIYRMNCTERETFQIPKAELKEYFNEYKYWLKREYQYQKNQNKS